jgi:hypothetical protein
MCTFVLDTFKALQWGKANITKVGKNVNKALFSCELLLYSPEPAAPLNFSLASDIQFHLYLQKQHRWEDSTFRELTIFNLQLKCGTKGFFLQRLCQNLPTQEATTPLSSWASLIWKPLAPRKVSLVMEHVARGHLSACSRNSCRADFFFPPTLYKQTNQIKYLRIFLIKGFD